jgi:hypothetical protein
MLCNRFEHPAPLKSMTFLYFTVGDATALTVIFVVTSCYFTSMDPADLKCVNWSDHSAKFIF